MNVNKGWGFPGWGCGCLRCSDSYASFRDGQDSVLLFTFTHAVPLYLLRRTKILTALRLRLQLQGELAARSHAKRAYTGVFQGVGVIYVKEGLRGLFAGLGAAVTGPFLPKPPTFPYPSITNCLESHSTATKPC